MKRAGWFVVATGVLALVAAYWFFEEDLFLSRVSAARGFKQYLYGDWRVQLTRDLILDHIGLQVLQPGAPVDAEVCTGMAVIGHRSHNWATCLTPLQHKLNRTEPCVVYGFGVGLYAHWDVAIARRFPNCEVHMFDPTPLAIKYARDLMQHVNLTNLFFHEIGIAGYDGTLELFVPGTNRSQQFTKTFVSEMTKNNTISVPVRRLSTIMQDLKHSQLDVLKLDIEGSEWDVLEDVYLSADLAKVDQLLFEFHNFDLSRDGCFSDQLSRMMFQVAAYGFEPFARTRWRQWFKSGVNLIEYSFLRRRDWAAARPHEEQLRQVLAHRLVAPEAHAPDAEDEEDSHMEPLNGAEASDLLQNGTQAVDALHNENRTANCTPCQSPPEPSSLPQPPAVTAVTSVSRAFRLSAFTCDMQNLVNGMPQSGLAVDVGTNEAEEAVVLAAHGLRVHSFEPTKAKLPKIRDVLTNAGVLDRVVLHHAAVSNFSGHTTFYSSNNQADSLIASNQPHSKNHTTVKVVRLDDIIEETGLVRILKTDTQGNDFNVLLGAEELITSGRVQSILMEFWPWGMRNAGSDPVAVLQWLAAKSFKCFDCHKADFEKQLGFPGLDRPSAFRDFVGSFKDKMWLNLYCELEAD